MKYPAILLCTLLLVISACQKSAEEPQDIVVEIGKTITFDYASGFANGTIFDTSFEEVAKKSGIYDPSRTYQPIVLRYGQDLILPGYEEALLGMKEGEARNILIPAAKAYGILLPNSTISLKRTQIQGQGNFSIGSVITIIGPNNQQIPAYIKEIGAENITVDLNHPLAGQNVQFSVILRKIE